MLTQCKSIFTTNYWSHLICLLSTVPSIIKAHLSWTWQCTTLMKGDEITNLPIFCVQPHRLFIPDYTTADGRRSGHGSHFFGVLSLYHKMKMAKPGVCNSTWSAIRTHPEHLTETRAELQLCSPGISPTETPSLSHWGSCNTITLCV